MSLVRRLSKAFTTESYSNGSANLERLFRRRSTYSGRVVTQDSSLSQATVYACVRLLSETLASLPLQVFERTDLGRQESDSPPWLRRPNGEMTRFRLIERTVASLLLDGNAFWLYQRDNLGRVTAVTPLHPANVGVCRNKDTGRIEYQIAGEDDARDSSTILHIPFFEGAGSLRGLSPIAACADAIGFAQSIDEYGAKLFSSGAYLSGVLESDQDMPEAEARRLQAQWTSDHAGLDNAHRPGLLTGGLKWKPLSLPNDQAQFLETRKFQVEEICRIFRCPPHMVQSLDRATFSNIEHQGIDFVTHSVRPIAVRIEDALLSLIDEGQYIRFNVGGLLRGDMLSRFQAHAIAINTGWESPNEVRALEDMNRADGLDEYRRPLNMAAVGASAVNEPTPAEIAEMIQKVYLGVGVVVSAEEARELLTRAGADLPGALPAPTTSGVPA